jgi:small GTP-binding protein
MDSSLILNGRRFSAKRNDLMVCTLFNSDPTLLAAPYDVKSTVPTVIFEEFLSALSGSDIELTDETIPSLSALCCEFGFGSLSLKLLDFQRRSSFCFLNADYGHSLSTIEERLTLTERETASFSFTVHQFRGLENEVSSLRRDVVELGSELRRISDHLNVQLSGQKTEFESQLRSVHSKVQSVIASTTKEIENRLNELHSEVHSTLNVQPPPAVPSPSASPTPTPIPTPTRPPPPPPTPPTRTPAKRSWFDRLTKRPEVPEIPQEETHPIDSDLGVLKICVAGDSETPKRTLMNLFCSPSFSLNRDKLTIGSGDWSRTVSVSGHTVALQIWDTSGQEKYRSLGPVYYRGAAGVLIVYDIGKQRTMISAVQWFSAARSINPEVVAILVGVKENAESPREVEEATGRELATREGILFAEVSLDSVAAVESAFMILTTEIVRRKLASRHE